MTDNEEAIPEVLNSDDRLEFEDVPSDNRMTFNKYIATHPALAAVREALERGINLAEEIGDGLAWNQIKESLRQLDALGKG